MGDSRRLAQWLVERRRPIDAALAARLGAPPSARSAEAEALRRFRSWVVLRLGTDTASAPSLDGLRVPARRIGRLLDHWIAACGEVAGPDRAPVEAALQPLAERFRLACSGSSDARRKSGPPQTSKRRAVSAAIDRIADLFLAIDVDDGAIVDANPAAGALLGVIRDQLLGTIVMDHVPPGAREALWAELDAIAEGEEQRRQRLHLLSNEIECVLDAQFTRFATRRRTLALVVARPPDAAGAVVSRPASRAGTERDATTRPPTPPPGRSPVVPRS